MKKLMIASLLAAQALGGAMPALAADFATAQDVEAGAFGGIRLRVPLGAPRTEPVRAGFAFAPTLRTRAATGETRMRIGEGLEFGYRSGRPLSFSIAGRDLRPRRFGAAEGRGPHGATTRDVLLIVGGVIIAGVAVATIVVVDELNEPHD